MSTEDESTEIQWIIIFILLVLSALIAWYENQLPY